MGHSNKGHTLTHEVVLEQLRQIVWSVIDEQDREKIDTNNITAATELAELLLDSLATIELMYAIEETFKVSINEEQSFEMRTVGNVIQFIQENQPSGVVQ